MDENALTTAQVAALAGVHRDTLLRWLRLGLIAEPERDRNGWRVFRQDDLRRVLEFARSGIHQPASRGPIDIQALHALDWDFHGATTDYLTHGIHPYPAKYIPQIPNTLIQELSSVGETVLDPFCGSGTTLVEALTLKRHAVGVDASPLAAMISRAKTTRLMPGDVDELRELWERADTLACKCAPIQEPTLFPQEPFRSAAPRPTDPAISFWFAEIVIEELAEILSWCDAVESPAARNLARTAFSSIVVAVSRQDSDTRYVRRKKNLSQGDTFRRFSRALRRATRAAREFTDVTEPRFQCRLIESSVLAKPAIGPVDLVVCSPPYPNAYSYHLYHMTRMLWLGMDQRTFKAAEIGSHRKYSSRGRNGATLATFVDEMHTVFSWLATILRPGKHACFVVGDSKIRGTIVDNANVLAEVAATHGFKEVGRIERRIQTTKRAFNPRIGRIRTEHILILRKRRDVWPS